jgi:Arc/MetJ-type ribon-helix-helix transcriptional regulator
MSFINLARVGLREIAMSKFDFSAPAELFPSRNRKIANKVKYRRFDHASDAIRFAVEELPEPLLLGAYIEIDEERLGHKDIRALYDSENFPLKKVANRVDV